MARARIDERSGETAVHTLLRSGQVRGVAGAAPRETGSEQGPAGGALGEVDRDVLALAVRYLLQCLGDAAPGRTVEVRVPPFGAVQVIEGPRHTRGTPPNIVETDPLTWVALATGRSSWAEALASGRVSASGSRADLAPLLPVGGWGRMEA